jgi:hypothetical protein
MQGEPKPIAHWRMAKTSTLRSHRTRLLGRSALRPAKLGNLTACLVIVLVLVVAAARCLTQPPLEQRHARHMAIRLMVVEPEQLREVDDDSAWLSTPPGIPLRRWGLWMSGTSPAATDSIACAEAKSSWWPESRSTRDTDRMAVGSAAEHRSTATAISTSQRSTMRLVFAP